MRRMLDPKTIGGGEGLPSTIKFDAEGNRTAEKNLTVGGDISSSELTTYCDQTGKLPVIYG